MSHIELRLESVFLKDIFGIHPDEKPYKTVIRMYIERHLVNSCYNTMTCPISRLSN